MPASGTWADGEVKGAVNVSCIGAWPLGWGSPPIPTFSSSLHKTVSREAKWKSGNPCCLCLRANLRKYKVNVSHQMQQNKSPLSGVASAPPRADGRNYAVLRVVFTGCQAKFRFGFCHLTSPLRERFSLCGRGKPVFISPRVNLVG